MGATQGPIPAFLGEQFPRSMRYSGISAGDQVGAALGGGTASSIATAILILTGHDPLGVALDGAAALALVAVCSLMLRETSRLSMAQIDEPATLRLNVAKGQGSYLQRAQRGVPIMSIERSIPELEAWYAQYDDISYRQASPDAYHLELVRTAEALRDEGAIDWDDWLALKALADQAHVHALEDAVQAHVSDPDA